jgi:AcrR family transcriptional regulator
MDELVAQCRMSKKTLYKLFPSKRAVLGMIVDDGRHAILGLPFEDDNASMMDALRHIFRVDVDDEVCVERIAIMRLCRQERSDSEEVELTLMQEIYDAYARQFGDWVTRQIALGRMRAIDSQVATTIMFEMFFGGLFTHDGRLKHWDSKIERRQFMEECIRVFVDGTRAG